MRGQIGWNANSQTAKSAFLDRSQLMPTAIVRTPRPEEDELQLKKLELGAIETQIAALQLELETLQTDLGAFSDRYLRTVGVKYAELDSIEAEIRRILAERQPLDTVARASAEKAKQRAEQSQRETQDAQARPERPAFHPAAESQDLYRNLVKRVHPDLARDPADRDRREHLMKAANQAYRAGDTATLQRLLNGLDTEPDPAAGDDIGTQLVKIIRRIAAAKRRIAELQQELVTVTASEAALLREKVDDAAAQGRDLLAELTNEVELGISTRRRELTTLTKMGCGG